MLRALFILFCCLVSLPLAAAEKGYRIFHRGGEQNGVLALLNPTARIDVWFFSAATSSLCVLDEGDGAARYGSLDAAMRAGRCVAGINGGYFAADAVSSPLGLLRHGGKQAAPLATGTFTVAGVLYDTGRDIRLERSRKLTTPIPHMREAVQGGPFLVEYGRKVRGLNATRKARRSFVATDGKGNWCLAMSSPLTLDELAEWLAREQGLGSFRVQTALNLDGGTSSTFWVAEPHVYRPGVKPVRNYIGVGPRAGRSGARR